MRHAVDSNYKSFPRKYLNEVIRILGNTGNKDTEKLSSDMTSKFKKMRDLGCEVA